MLAAGRPVVKQAVEAGKEEGNADAVPDPLHPIELFVRAYGIDVREG